MENQRIQSIPRSLQPLYPLLAACGFGLVLGLAAVKFSSLLILVGLLGVFFLALVSWKPELGLLSILVITSDLINSDRLPAISVGPISLQITDAILIYLLILTLVRVLVLPGFSLVRTPLDLPMLLFFGAVLLSTALAVTNPSVDYHWILRRLRPLAYYLGFFCVTNLIRERRQLIVLIQGILAITVLACLILVLQAVVPSIHLITSNSEELVTAGQSFAGVNRVFTQTDRLIYPLLLVSICALILGARWLPPMLEFGRFGIIGAGLFLTFQRNYWLSMILMLALLFVLVSGPWRSRILKWGGFGMAILLLAIALAGTSADKYLAAANDRFIRGLSPGTLAQDSSTQDRLVETNFAIQSIRSHPLLGVGLGNFYRPPLPSDPYWMPDFPQIGLRWYIHNAYLWVWIDMGLVGFIPFLWLYAVFIIRGLTRWRKITDPNLRAVVLGSTLGVLGQAISNIVAPNFLQTWVLIIFAVLMGINELIYRWEPALGGKSVPPPLDRMA